MAASRGPFGTLTQWESYSEQQTLRQRFRFIIESIGDEQRFVLIGSRSEAVVVIVSGPAK